MGDLKIQDSNLPIFWLGFRNLKQGESRGIFRFCWGGGAGTCYCRGLGSLEIKAVFLSTISMVSIRPRTHLFTRLSKGDVRKSFGHQYKDFMRKVQGGLFR